jgi:hypothetical protein
VGVEEPAPTKLNSMGVRMENKELDELVKKFISENIEPESVCSNSEERDFRLIAISISKAAFKAGFHARDAEISELEDKLYHASREADAVRYELEPKIQKLEEALTSISNNTCCECCGQAAIVAKKALK